MTDREVKVIKKKDAPDDKCEPKSEMSDQERLELSLFQILAMKYPQKARKILRKLQMEIL